MRTELIAIRAAELCRSCDRPKAGPPRQDAAFDEGSSAWRKAMDAAAATGLHAEEPRYCYRRVTALLNRERTGRVSQKPFTESCAETSCA